MLFFKTLLVRLISGKMRLVETVPGMGGEGIKENDGGVNSTMMYCKTFCKCPRRSQVQQ
jgi:hypothetical protein